MAKQSSPSSGLDRDQAQKLYDQCKTTIAGTAPDCTMPYSDEKHIDKIKQQMNDLQERFPGVK